MIRAKEIQLYRTIDGKVPFDEWLFSLKNDIAITRVWARLDRLLLGNFGDCKVISGWIFELRFHFGPGYRVYFCLDNAVIVVLLWGGDKSRQEQDIKRACAYWKDYLRRRS